NRIYHTNADNAVLDYSFAVLTNVGPTHITGTDSANKSIIAVGVIDGQVVAGQLYLDTDTSQDLTANYVAITNMSQTNITCCTAGPSAITNACAGTYLISAHIEGELANNESGFMAVFVDGVEQTHIRRHFSTPAAGQDHAGGSCAGLVVLEAGQAIELRLKSEDAAAVWTTHNVQLVLTRLN
ncbi:unnamed protein product, partial [marine sediment metagenome]